MAKAKATADWKRYKVEVVRHEIAEAKVLRVERPQSAVELFSDDANRLMTESLWVMTLGGRNDLLGIEQVYSGTATGTSVRIGELFRYAVAVGGVGIVAVHNHPSGDSEPSNEDKKLTAELIAAAKILDIDVLDHLVIGGNGSFTSIRSRHGEIWSADEITDQKKIAKDEIINQMRIAATMS